MANLNFQKLFASKVKSGEKNQTIRKYSPYWDSVRPGDKLYLFTGLRTKHCQRIITPNNMRIYDRILKKGYYTVDYVPCKSIERIRIGNYVVWLGEVDFSNPERINYDKQSIVGLKLHDFAVSDGFNNSQEMFQFFDKLYGLPVDAVLIKW